MRAGRYSAHTVNGAWSAWTSWSQCSRDCSRGIRNRKRVCNNPEPKYGGMPCLGPSLEYQECNILPCPGEWSEESEKIKGLGRPLDGGEAQPSTGFPGFMFTSEREREMPILKILRVQFQTTEMKQIMQSINSNAYKSYVYIML